MYWQRILVKSSKQDADTTESRQGTEQTRTFDPTNNSADCWSAMHSCNIIIRVKKRSK